LISFAVIRLKKNQHRFILIVHHLVSDGFTLAIILKDLFKFYMNPDIKTEAVDNSYKKYVKAIAQIEKDSVLKNHHEFWNNQIQGRKMSFPTDTEKGPNNIASEKEYKKYYSFKKLGATRVVLKNKMFYYLSVGLYKCLAKWTNNNNKVIVIHRLNRRNLESGGNFFNTAGWFAGDVPLSFSLDPELSVKEQIQQFYKQFNMIPMGGVTYEILSNQGLLPCAHKVGPIRLNFQPDLFVNIDADAKLYEPPEHNRLYIIDLIARMKKDGLEVIARYSKNLHNINTIKQFIKMWFEDINESIFKDSGNI
jgi:hypothetical protein